MTTITRQEHIEYLRQTLIPDLVESGRLAMAVDFEICCRFMETMPGVNELGDVFTMATGNDSVSCDNDMDTNAQMLEFINQWKERV